MNWIGYFNSRREEMIHLLEEMVKRESPSSDKKAVDICSSFIIKKFERLTSKITRFHKKNIGDLFFIEYPFPDVGTKKDQILLLTHLDTVWPVGTINKMPFRISGNKIYGPGVLDMKAGLVMALFALKAIKEMKVVPRRRIGIFINSAEEIGSRESYELIKKLARKSLCVLCLEPSLPGGNLKLQRKGRLVLRLDSRGKAAHGGTPEKGVNAIEELLYQLRLARKLKTKETSVNIGLIGGGEKANVVPSEAWAVLDIRFWKNARKEKILDFFRDLKPHLGGARIKYSIQSMTPPMEKTSASINLFQKIRKIGRSLNMSLEGGKTGGGSDASIASSLGIPTVDGLGPDGDGIHAENEHLILPSLIKRTALLAEILHKL